MAETEPTTIDGITEGDKYRLKEPDWKPHINGHGPNKGFRYNDELIPWGSTVIAHANDAAGTVYREDGDIYVHCRLIAEMRPEGNKQFIKI